MPTKPGVPLVAKTVLRLEVPAMLIVPLLRPSLPLRFSQTCYKFLIYLCPFSRIPIPVLSPKPVPL